MKVIIYLIIFIIIYISLRQIIFNNQVYIYNHIQNNIYISGELYKLNSKYNLDNRYPLIPFDNTLIENDTVFLNISDIESFILSPPYVKIILIVSNSDETFDDNYMSKVKPYVNKVYASNCSAKDAIQIPLGFRDNQYTSHKFLTDILNDSNIPSQKNIFCLLNFLIETNSEERNKAFNYFNIQSWVTSNNDYFKYDLSKSLNHSDTDIIQKRIDYYTLLKQTKFVICPPGTGVDTHRVYESLFFGAIPIIKSSFLDPMYIKIGGCWIVNDWNDVTEESCNNFYNNPNKTIPSFSTFTMSFQDYV
jgi:hypothetical protein